MIVLQQIDRRTRLGSILLDVLVTEEINLESEVTVYPVEDGSEINDHITQGTERIRISGQIGTADVSGGYGIASTFGQSQDNSTKLIDVVEALRAMHDARQPVTVSTGQLLYEHMAFTNLSATRTSDGDGGNWLTINAELVKIRKVKLKTADVPAPETAAPSAAGRTGQTNKPAGKSTQASTGNRAASNSNTYGPQQNPNDSTAAARLRDKMRTAKPDAFTGAVSNAVGSIF